MNEIKPPSHSSQQEYDEEEIHRLSFCDLPIAAATPHTFTSQPDYRFSFSVTATAAASQSFKNDDIVFCGKVIHAGDDHDQLNEFQKGDYIAAVKSRSVPKPSFNDCGGAAEKRRVSPSTRFAGGDLAKPKCKTGDVAYHAQRVNISSLTSMSAKSRRRMFMFGPVKFKPEMELSAIKQRQSKPVVAAAEKEKEKEKETTSPSGGGGKSHWRLLRSSSHLVSLLARSCSCIPMNGGGGIERWVEAR